MSTPVYLLCIETSTTNCSVAISKNGIIITEKEDNSAQYSHAENLHVFIKELLDSEKIATNQLSGVVVSKGPGSYTGLRIGVSASKGLCYALDIPLIAVNTLESLLYQIPREGEESYVIPMLDARRMEVYTAVFDSYFKEIETTQALVLDATSYSNYLNQKNCIFVGNGVAKFQAICKHPNAFFIPKALPSAKQLGAIGYNKYCQKQFEDVAYFEPYYLKDFVAIKPKK